MSGPPAVQLDETYAPQVAAGFLDTPSMPRDPFTAAAYRLLEMRTDRLFYGLTGPGAARSVRVAFTRCRAPYASDGEPGGSYDRFRAVHDLVGHVRPGHGFDRHGEFAAWLAQDSLYRGLARRALVSELHAEHSVRWTTGVLAEHKATLIATHVVLRARRGLLGRRA
jgi:hypothetical protein